MFSPTFPDTVLSKAKDALPLHLKETFPPIIWIFNEGESKKPLEHCMIFNAKEIELNNVNKPYF